MPASNLTVNEAAELSGVSLRSIEKAAEEGIVTKKLLKGTLRPGARGPCAAADCCLRFCHEARSRDPDGHQDKEASVQLYQGVRR